MYLSPLFTNFDLLTREKSSLNLDDEIQILISCESDVNAQLALYSYWQESKKKKNFKKENFIEDILTKSFQFQTFTYITQKKT